MTTQTKMSNPLFPDLPREAPAVNKEGNFTHLWALGFNDLFQALQTNFKNEGILLPALNATQISNIQSIYAPFIGFPLPQNIPDISGQTIFDSTNRVPKVFIITYSGANIATAAWKTYTIT